MRRYLDLVRDVIAGLREQRARRRFAPPPAGALAQSRPTGAGDGRIGFRGPLVAALVLSVLGLALTGATTLLISTLVLAALVWAVEEGDQSSRRPQVVVTHAPAPHAPDVQQPTDAPTDRPPPGAVRRPARDGRGLDYEATLAELMAIVGAPVVVDVAPAAERGVATRLTGTLAPGSVDEQSAAGRTGRGLFFGVGDGSGFFLPALDFLGARRSEGELTIRLRSYSVMVRDGVPGESQQTRSVSAS